MDCLGQECPVSGDIPEFSGRLYDPRFNIFLWGLAMPLITDKIKENAEKCKRCAFLKIRNMEIDKNSVLFDEAVITLEGIYRASCTMCPFAKDFEKVFGMKPYDYFPMKNVVVKD